MTKQIPGVPESLSREQYLSLFHGVGIDPARTLSLRFLADGVEAVVFAVDEQGKKILANDHEDLVAGSGWAKHTIHIPVR